MKFRTHSRWAITVAAAMGLSGLCLPAVATLGGDLNSVQQDQAQMKATVKVKQAEAYAVHEIKDPHGTVVREYVSPEGRVFGVAWQGPFMPDLHQLLGTYLQQFSSAVQEDHAKHPGRHPLSISQPGLVVETSGRMRAYYGRAFVPDMVPQAVKTREIQ